MGPGPDDKRLRAAARLAVRVAREGEAADPRLAAPAALRPVLTFNRLSAASYRTIHRVIDDDGVFRARVADEADEADVGRVGWLWLHRPVGWLDEVAQPADAAEAPPPERDGEPAAKGAKDASAKHKRAAKEAEAARRRAADELAEVRRALRAAEGERDELAERVAELERERSAARRDAKQVEAKLADARRDLKVARTASREAEAELAELRAGVVAGRGGPGEGGAARPAEPAAAPTGAASPLDDGGSPSVLSRSGLDGAAVAALGGEVAAAADAAAALAEALARAAARLAPPPAADPAPPVRPPAPSAERPGAGAGRARRSRRPRPLPALPPGTFDGTPEAHRHVLADRSNLVLVDGYNLARTAWSGLAPEEERRRTVALLDDVQARSKGTVTVVFDGADDVVAPPASRRVRTRFSATGQTADDAIVELLDALPADVPVVVVSSDRAVVRDARSRGAATMSSAELLAATGR